MLSFEHTLCVTQLSSPTRTVFPAEAVPLSNHWISERCDFPLDNHDTHSRRGRSCPKNTESAEIHSADIKALEEMGFFRLSCETQQTAPCLCSLLRLRHLPGASVGGTSETVLLPRSLTGTNVSPVAHRCPLAMPENRRHSAC